MSVDQCKAPRQKNFVIRVLVQAAAVFFLVNLCMPLAVYPDSDTYRRPAATWKWPDVPAVEQVNGIDGVFGRKENIQPVNSGGKEAPDKDSLQEAAGNGDTGPAAVFRGNPQADKKVALTFDDGPYPVWTAEYLKILEDYEAKATFFVVGRRVEIYPELAKKIAASGNEIGIHSYGHGRLKEMTKVQVEEDFQKSSEAIKKVLGLEFQLGFFRPPYGSYNDIVVDTAKEFGLVTVNWNLDPRDWDNAGAEEISSHILSHVGSGSVVILHEGRESTLKALPKIIAGLRDMGYELVTVSELMYNVTPIDI